ncbi:Chitin synthase, class 7 [Chytridiales sp. JEL 0842]|nr:Chitin synthase, class 7 [Chytridiales sp. JEL 0842]
MSSFPIQPASTSFAFGSFDYFCSQVALPLCPLVGQQGGIEPQCYGRNVEFAGGMLVFSPATLVIHIIALIMTGIMIYNIKSKYTAVGRKEMVVFFYMYALTTLVEFFLVSGIIPSASVVYSYFAAAHVGLVLTTLWTLLFNGFVGFQWAEDGTPTSLWSLRLSALAVFVLTFIVAILTFQSTAIFSAANPLGLFVVYFVFGGAFILIYVALQVVLVLKTLDDRWPLGDLLFGVAFFLLSILFEFLVSTKVCEAAKHYVDGLFFGTICILLAVMMVYKYWDSITKEDLEFAVGGRAGVWEVRDPLLGDDVLGKELAASQ